MLLATTPPSSVPRIMPSIEQNPRQSRVSRTAAATAVASNDTVMEKPTMRDVGRRAGVSAMTVSRVLSGKSVADETRERVRAAVAEMGYRRNEVARSLRKGLGTGLVGLIVTDLGNPFYAHLARGVEELVAMEGIRVVIASSRQDPALEQSLVEEFIARQVAGLIVVPLGADQSHLASAVLGPVPVVLAVRPSFGIEADCVLLDDFGGAREATDLLIRGGHTRIGYLGLNPVWTSTERYRGHCSAMNDAGIDVADDLAARHHASVEVAEQATRELLAMPDPPTALFCDNNRNTLGACRALASTGQSIPIAGFDELEASDLLGFQLALVTYRPEELGRNAARALVARLGGDTSPAQRTVLTTNLVMTGGWARTAVARSDDVHRPS
ncbi:MAG: LacI family DNA-binding transcriptional regulator [Acidimicrobiia bacterium]|nr:MAG: LacI family DNA-binding transcriptional regulator [Acidimicrobiia bacterium]